MDKKENNEDFIVRLILKSNEDQPIYDYFKKIKNYLGLKVNTEVARYCIKRAYESMFQEESYLRVNKDRFILKSHFFEQIEKGKTIDQILKDSDNLKYEKISFKK